MFKSNKLFVYTLLTLAIALYWVGCDQPEDVLTPISKSDVFLLEQSLPSNPASMHYELWVSNDNETVSVGKFGYDQVMKNFLDLDGDIRTDSNKFHVDFDIADYETIFVSVENNTDADPLTPGPIMLTDNLASPTVEMVFPKNDSLWESTIRYSMVTTSNGLNAGTNSSGIWFASFQLITEPYNDTVLSGGNLDWSITLGEYVDCSKFIEANIIYDLVNIEQYDTTVILGLDTLDHTAVRFDVIDSVKICDYYPTVLVINYNVIPGTVTYESFTQDNFALPDISAYGWKYKGWVVSPEIPTSAVGEMTLPAWEIIGDELAETDGGLLSTGKFVDVTKKDLDNSYVASSRIPDFPGEDFLSNLPGGMTSVDLVPLTSGNQGKVFITLEPDNYVDTTNFPLIAFVGDIPDTRASVMASISQGFTLRGWMQTNDPYRGFPKVRVNISRY